MIIVVNAARHRMLMHALEQFICNQGVHIDEQGDDATDEERALLAAAEELNDEILAPLVAVADAPRAAPTDAA